MCKNGYLNCGLEKTSFCEDCKSNKSVDDILNQLEHLKVIEQLKEGKCKVVTKYIHGIKIFDGVYDSKYPCVFFAIPSTYEVIGYIQ